MGNIPLLEWHDENWAKWERELDILMSEAAKYEIDYSSSARENKALKSELESMSSVKEQLKSKLKDYKQRLENVAKVESDRNQVQKIFTLLLEL